MRFLSRQDAGRRLGTWLQEHKVCADLVLGLPRGGVVVAAGVAATLRLPLDALVVRKLGHPLQREFAVGALAENGIVILDERVVGHNPLVRAELDEIVAEEKERLASYEARFHACGVSRLEGKSVLLVDDGLATGSTTEAAVLSAKSQGAQRAMVAVPVASASAVERLKRVADDVYALIVDPAFDAVGHYYEEFSQTTDEEVIELLRAA